MSVIDSRVINIDQLQLEHFAKGDKFECDAVRIGPLLGAIARFFGGSFETLEFQNSVMSHLQARVMSGFIPHALPTKSDERIATAVDEEGARHFVRLVTYLPASLLAAVNPHTPELHRVPNSAPPRLASV